MTWAIVAVVVLLVGLPLAAVWWSRRAVWSRLRPGRDRDLFGDTMRKHGLGPAAMARVENAVLWGKRLDDPAERAAVVDLARAGLPRPVMEVRRTVVLVLLIAWITLVVTTVVFAVVDGRWGDVNWFIVLWLMPVWWATGGPRRAIRRNADPSPDGPTTDRS